MNAVRMYTMEFYKFNKKWRKNRMPLIIWIVLVVQGSSLLKNVILAIVEDHDTDTLTNFVAFIVKLVVFIWLLVYFQT